MPSAKILSEKKKIVEELTGKLKSKAGVFVNYSGITVNEDTEMRVKMREANVDYTVIKNTLMRFAINNVGFEELDPILNGTTSLAVSQDDPVAPARIIKEYADKLANYFEIKGGFMDGKILSVDEVNALASIPALPVLQAQLLGTMLAPIATLAVVLKAIAEKGGAPVDAEVAVDESAPVEETVAEAPAPVEEAVAEEAPVEEAAAEEAPVEEAVPVEHETPKEKPPAKKTASKAKPKAEAAAAAEEQNVAGVQSDADSAAEKPAPKKTASKAKPKAALPADDAVASEAAAEASEKPAKKPVAKSAAAKTKAKAADKEPPTEDKAAGSEE